MNHVLMDRLWSSSFASKLPRFMPVFNDKTMRELLRRKPPQQTVKDFCREHQLCEATYYNWKRKLSLQDISGSPVRDQSEFIPLQVNGLPKQEQLLARITLPGGASMDIYHPIAFTLLQDLL